MSITKLIELANQSGGTLYLMALLLLVALTVIIERSLYLSKMLQGGNVLIELLQRGTSLNAELMKTTLIEHEKLPHVSIVQAAMLEHSSTERETCSGHMEEAIMHEVPSLDRSLWVLDTVITLAPLLGLFGTIIGMFGAFSVLGDVQNAAGQVTEGIAEALIATASGLLIAMIGLVFFNWLTTKVRTIVHQMEVIKLMILNRRLTPPTAMQPGTKLKAV